MVRGYAGLGGDGGGYVSCVCMFLRGGDVDSSPSVIKRTLRLEMSNISLPFTRFNGGGRSAAARDVLPDACFSRIRGMLFFGPAFRVTRNKLSFRDNLGAHNNLSITVDLAGTRRVGTCPEKAALFGFENCKYASERSILWACASRHPMEHEECWFGDSGKAYLHLVDLCGAWVRCHHSSLWLMCKDWSAR